MAFGIPSKNGVFRIADVGSVMRTFTCNLQSFSRKNTRTMTENETYCTIEKAPGSNNITYTGKGVYAGGADEIDEVMEELVNYTTAPTFYEWFPEGLTAGKPRYYGSGWVSDKNIDAATPGSVLTDFTVASVSDTRGVSSGS
jgi:hypothetical protein